jgi:hypothetical protein
VVEAGGRVTRYADGFLVARGADGGDPLTAACRADGDAPLYCRVDRVDDRGLGVHWSFSAPPEAAANRLLVIDAWVGRLLASLE